MLVFYSLCEQHLINIYYMTGVIICCIICCGNNNRCYFWVFYTIIWSYPCKNTVNRYCYYVPHVNRWANWASHLLITVTCPRLHSVRSESWNQTTVLQNPGKNLVSVLWPHGSKQDKMRLQSNGRSNNIFSTKLLPYLTYKKPLGYP